MYRFYVFLYNFGVPSFVLRIVAFPSFSFRFLREKFFAFLRFLYFFFRKLFYRMDRWLDRQLIKPVDGLQQISDGFLFGFYIVLFLFFASFVYRLFHA